MKKFASLAIVVVGALGLTACTSTERNLTGAAVGGGTGALLGSSIGGTPGAVVGGAAGAVGGMAVADQMR